MSIVIVAIIAIALVLLAVEGDEHGVLHLRKSNMYPEGMDWDAKHSRFLVGSMVSPSLFALGGEGRDLTTFLKDPLLKNTTAFLGVRVDRPRNRVLTVATSSLYKKPGTNQVQPGMQALVGYDLDTTSRVLFARLDNVLPSTTTGPSHGNDVAVDFQGNAYVTNSKDNFIWKVTPKGVVTIFTDDQVLQSQAVVTAPDDLATPCGLDGIAYHQHGDCLLVVQSNTGTLFRVNVDTAKVDVVKLPQPLPGADGIAFRKDGALVVISSEKAWLLQSNRGWLSAAIEDELLLDGASCFPTAVAIRNGFKLHVLCSHLRDFVEGKFRGQFSIRHVEFPKDASDDPLWLIGVIVLAVLLVLGWRFQMKRFFNDFKNKRL